MFAFFFKIINRKWYSPNSMPRLLAYLYLFSAVDGARILGLFPANAKSHFTFNEAIMNALHAAGHHITLVSPFPSSTILENYTVIDSNIDKFVYVGQSSINEFVRLNLWQQLTFEANWAEKPCHNVMRLEEIQNLLKSPAKEYDVMFVEMVSMYQCHMPLAAKLGIPVVGTTAMRSWVRTDWDLGIPYNPSVIPYEMSDLASTKTFTHRLKNVWYWFVTHLFNLVVVGARLRAFYELHYPNTSLPMTKTPSLVFRNSHPSFSTRALPPHAIDVAGIHIKPPRALPQRFQDFINGHEPGVIVFSFGSFMKGSSVDDNLKRIFMKVFSSVPQRVIWKHEERIENLPDNILLDPWFPQRDILAHENVKAFITHCGQASTFEAIHANKPVVMIPLTFDQISNGRVLEDLGVGVYVDIQTVSEQKLLNAINEIVNNSRYAEKMRRVSWQFRDRELSAEESVVYWTEYVIRHGGAAHLQPVANEMPLFQFLTLDIVAVVCASIAACVYGFGKLVSGAIKIRSLRCSCKEKKKKQS